eukprot:gene24486-31886_t
MGNIPVIHELLTSGLSLGHAICGDTNRAREVWCEYSEKSILGSGVYAAIVASNGDLDRANELGKGMLRATCGVLDVSRSIPVLHEIAVASDSLSDAILGETDQAGDRWKHYIDDSLLGSFVYSAVEKVNGNIEHANELMEKSGRKLASGLIETVTVAACILTDGVAAPFLLPAGAVGQAVVNDELHNMKPGEFVGAAINGVLMLGAAKGIKKIQLERNAKVAAFKGAAEVAAIEENAVQAAKRKSAAPAPGPNSVQGKPLPKDQRSGNAIPSSDAPHTQLAVRNGTKGRYQQAREFGNNGELVSDIDFTNHGRPDHPNPHMHRQRRDPNLPRQHPTRSDNEPFRMELSAGTTDIIVEDIKKILNDKVDDHTSAFIGIVAKDERREKLKKQSR